MEEEMLKSLLKLAQEDVEIWKDLYKQEKEKNKQWEDKIREKIKAYENKCAVLRKDSSTFQWYEMGKNVGSANALQELLEE